MVCRGPAEPWDGVREKSPEEFRLQREKVRVYSLARELNVESKDLLELCRQAGIDVKNQLSSLDPEQRDLVEQMVKRGGGTATATAVAPAPAKPPSLTNLSRAVPVLPAGSRRAAETAAPAAPAAPPAPAAGPTPPAAAPPPSPAAPTPSATPKEPPAAAAQAK